MATRSPAAKQLSRRIMVLINRDPMLKTPRVIWQHELPILNEVFGDGNVTDIDPKTLDEGYESKQRPDLLAYNKTQDLIGRPSEQQGIGFVFIGDAASEYARLAQVYGKHPEENVSFVEKVYGRAQTMMFERLLGAPELEDLPEAQLRSLILDYGYAPQPHKDASAAEKAEVAAQRKALAGMDMDGLLKIAAQVGIQLG